MRFNALTSGLIPLFLSLTCGFAADGSQALFNATDLSGWRPPTGTWQVAAGVSIDSANPQIFIIQPGTGVLVNTPKAPTVNLISVEEFGDVELHVEFCIP